jgi:hypothetical protein
MSASKKRFSRNGGEAVLLLAEELSHARLPPAALVQGDASVLGAAAREAGALPPQHVHELLLGQALHLLHVVLVVAEVEVYVGVDAAELDRRPIIRPCSSMSSVESTQVHLLAAIPNMGFPASGAAVEGDAAVLRAA